MQSGEWRHLQESYLELRADGGPAVLRTDLQRVLLVAALDSFKQVVDKVQAGVGAGHRVSGAEHAGRRCF